MVYILGCLYLLIPALIFVCGWIRPEAAIIIMIMLVIAGAAIIRNRPDTNKLHYDKKKIILVISIIIIWVLLSGVGGIVWQNRWDHKFRNAIFMDLVNFDWPVKNGDYALCYYFGYWLPSALAGKIFGLNAGYIFQTIWAVIGVTIAIFLVFQYTGQFNVRTLIIFIFYSGWDIVLYAGSLLFSGKFSIESLLLAIASGEHLELITQYFNSSSNTTLLFWLYNQIIPCWIGMMMMLLQKNGKNIVAIYALLALYCPFPLITLGLVIVSLFFRDYIAKKEYKNSWNYFTGRIKEFCTLQNLCVLPFAFTVVLFYKSNHSVGHIGIQSVNATILMIFIAHLICEYIVYFIFVYKENKKDKILPVLIIGTMICSFILLGYGRDFAARTCIPLSFYLMLLVIKKMNDSGFSGWKRKFLIAALCIGAVTPATEMLRTIRYETYVIAGRETARSDSLPSTFEHENNECYNNFIADVHTSFFQYIGKRD